MTQTKSLLMTLTLAFLLSSATYADQTKTPALDAAKQLEGTYIGGWEMFGLNDKTEVVQISSWTDVVQTTPAINDGKNAYITATDKMTFSNGGTSTYSWHEGFFVNSDGSAGEHFFDTGGVISIEKQLSDTTWVIDAEANSQDLQGLGIKNATYGRHVTVKNVVLESDFETEYVTRVTTAKWTDSKGQTQEKQFVSMKGTHKHLRDSVNYYYGEVSYLSPDGKTTYGKTSSLVLRTVSPSHSKIIEDVLQPARTPGQKPAEFITNIIQTDGTSNILEVSDQGNTFSGTITFTGPTWQWNSWTYSITIASGGSLQGQGSLSEKGIQTQKIFLDKDGKATTQIIENLAPITSGRYQELRKEMGTP